MNFYEIIIIINIVFLVSYLFISFKLYRSLNKLDYPANAIQPIVSIIICLHNEEKNADHLINCLVSQDYPKEQFEIVLVNDRSTDNTQKLLEIAEDTHQNIKIIKIENLQKNFAPKKFAIDTAIKKAKGEIVLLTDADGRPHFGWIKSMLSNFSQDTGMVIGNAPYFTKTVMQKILAIEYFSHATIAATTVGMGYPLTCVGTNMAYRKQVYSEIDGFGEFKNVHTGDDDLLLQRVRDNSKWKIRYALAKESQIKNAAPNSIKQFMNQRLRYASKGFKYPFNVTISLVAYYFFNVFLFLMGMLCVVNFMPFATILFLKGLADFCLMKKSAGVLNTKIHFGLFPIVNILHIPYVIFFGLMGNIKKYEWAGINH
jgi:cellulose synthase/poly-beta-1,6-N-acetylglucosamine synthase-like glycosyltransferase